LAIPIKHLVIRNVYKVWLRNLKNRQYLEDLNANGENNKMDLHKKGEKMAQIGFIQCTILFNDALL